MTSFVRRFLVLLSATSLLFAPLFVSAQTISSQSTGLDQAAAGTGLVNTCQGNCIPGLIGNLINAVLGVLGIVLLGLFLYAGFMWMTAGGETERVKKAKSMIVNAVAGLVIIVASYAITSYVISTLGQAFGGGAQQQGQQINGGAQQQGP